MDPMDQGGGLLAPRRDVSLRWHHRASALDFSTVAVAENPVSHLNLGEISGAPKRVGEVQC